jgi:acetamidase/formamidase
MMTTHHFQPTLYYSTLGVHPPVLAIADGDSVVTTTVDSGGYDANGVRHATGDNPMTGPFFVEGAEPGDALAVRIDRLFPNRAHGISSAVVATNVVDPDFVRGLPEERLVRWELDLQHGTATLPAWGLSGQALTLPLEPMLGCLGVAADWGQAITTDTSGRHGGNMDYRGVREGATVIFPVFEPGALFFLGDGHATQGDGEIVGSGIEVSMDVRFRVQVLKGKQVGWPRVETDEELIALGNARPLDQALQHATTELLRWLEQDYRLDTTAASILLGQRVAYEVANVYDPAYTVAAKIGRRWLS